MHQLKKCPSTRSVLAAELLFLDFVVSVIYTPFSTRTNDASFYLISGMLGLPTRNGKLKDICQFDASFFGVHPKQANAMDPQLRMLLEVTYEALVDAGKRS